MGRWIVLIGYMGAGKSTVGPAVAERLDCPFVDCDATIEAEAEMTISEIFSRRGEVWFRRTEERVIRDILAGSEGVLALGGGAVESARTRDLLGRSAHVAWLSLDAERSWTRVEGSERPLAKDRARFVRRAAEREPRYRGAADQVVDAAQGVDEIVEQVVASAAGERAGA